ncbi:hypothetical protein [Methylibium petroleiphilum]
MATPSYDLAKILKDAGIGSNFVNITNVGKNNLSIQQLYDSVLGANSGDTGDWEGALGSGWGLVGETGPAEGFISNLRKNVKLGQYQPVTYGGYKGAIGYDGPVDQGAGAYYQGADLKKELADQYGAGGYDSYAFIDPKTLQQKIAYVGSNGKLMGVSTSSQKDKWYQSAIKIGVPLGLAAITGNIGAAAAGGAGTLAGAAAGGATAGGVQAATTGGDIGKGILLGGALGGLGAGIKNVVSPGLTEALGPTGGKIATGALQGAGKALLTGGDVGKALLTGGLNAGIKTGLGSLTSSLVPGGASANDFIDQRDDPLLNGNGGTAMDTDWEDLWDNGGGNANDWGFNIGDVSGDWFGSAGDGGSSGGSGITSGLGGLLANAGSGLMSFLKDNPKLLATLGSTGLAALAAGKPGPVDPRVSAAIDQIKSISGKQLGLADESYAANKALLAEFSPLLRQQLQQSIAAQGKANSRADDVWSNYVTNFLPVQNKLASDALGFDTAARRTAAQQEAEGLVASNFQTQREQMAQAQMGQQVGSDASAANDAALRIAEAKARAGAGTAARADVENRGLQLVDNATRVGMQLPGLSTQQSALGLQQGQQVQNNVKSVADLTNLPTAAAAPLYRDAINGATTTANAGIGLTAANNGVYNAKAGLVGDLLGAGLAAYGYYGKP